MGTLKQKKNIFIIFSYIMLVVVLPVTLFFSGYINKEMTLQIQQTINNEASLCADMIKHQYGSDMLLLESLAIGVEDGYQDGTLFNIKRMQSMADRYGMKRIAFTALDGSTISTDGVEMNLKGIPNIERALSGDAHLTTVISDEADGKDVNIYSMPVYDSKTGEIFGVLSAVYDSEVFRELLSVTAFEGESYTYIVDGNGNVVINTNHHNAIVGLQNVFTHMATYSQNDVSIANIKKNMETHSLCFFEVYDRSGNKFACTYPLEINDWYVVSVVPKAIAEASKNTIMYSVAVYCFVISLIAIFVVLSIRNAQKEKNKLLKQALYVDSLTGGSSYAKFCIDSRQRLDKDKNHNAVCVFLDIDNFNLIATLYGNEESDKTICQIHSIIEKCVGENGIFCRNSSDQFCVMYFYVNIEEMEESLQQFISVLHSNRAMEHILRPSLGIYVVEDRDENVEDMITKARIAHETIKQTSESNVAYYDESFRNKMYENRHMEDEMELALDRHEFVPYIQPKYNAFTGEICGAEALIRWITADGMVISPGKFIPLAENNGFIRHLDREMFAMVCRIQKHFVDSGIKPVPISVNVSRQLMYDRNFVEDYQQAIKNMGLTNDMVELEITESALFEDLDLFRNTLEKLRGYGFRILMDDFGTGYSSLMMLKSVPIDEIKLDKSFIDDYNDEKGSSIICCVLNLAKMLELPVVAEGVETENQYLYLKQRGCEVIQGYYFAKPMPAAEYVKRMKQE